VAGWAPMGPLNTTTIRTDLNLTTSDQPETIILAVIDVLYASLTIHVGLTLRPPCQLRPPWFVTSLRGCMTRLA
jgi:hypothetical protein